MSILPTTCRLQQSDAVRHDILVGMSLATLPVFHALGMERGPHGGEFCNHMIVFVIHPQQTTMTMSIMKL